MIIVTGTKRSGTSMWMQILRAAGLDLHGARFLHDWDEVIREANPEGFYESQLRNGINFRTNPNPKTNEYLDPTETQNTVVKVFVPGLVRSDLAYVHRVVGTMRDWREYVGSLERLYLLERTNRSAKLGRELPERQYPSAVLEWWAENFALVSDIIRRRYPVHVVAYESTLAQPDAVIGEVLGWLGLGDAEAARLAVKPHLRTHEGVRHVDAPEVTAEHADVFDELYARVRDRKALDLAFIDKLNATNDALRPAIVEMMRKQTKQRAELRRKRITEQRDRTPRADRE